MPTRSSRTKDHQEELEELQKRFSHLAEQQKTTELQSSSLLLATRKSDGRSMKTFSVSGESTAERNEGRNEEELRRLDEQIVSLRRKHDQLHEKNQKKRSELDSLADKLKDLHNTRFNPKETPESRLAEMEARLAECAARYDEEHRLRMSYDQVINRLKQEQLEWPADIKALESVLVQKETDYEQLLVMSHDANSSKEAAKVELGKFESLVLDERKQREKELQERRAILQKKQQLATELDRAERERKQQLQEQQRQMGEDTAKAEAMKMEALIKEEHAKIAAYEAAFQQIKEATGVSDVNEVIQRFLLQEETHQNLLNMTRESQSRIDELRRAVEEEKTLVMSAEYSAAGGEAEPGETGETHDAGRSSTQAAQKQLTRARERWKKVLKTAVSTKSAVQHIVDVLEPLREKDEVVAPMSDDTLMQHISFVENKLHTIASAFSAMEEDHKNMLASVSAPMPAKVMAASSAGSAYGGLNKDEAGDSEDEFEEDMEEDVMDRSALKKQSTTIVDKGAKKKKPRRRRAKGAGDD
uniref:ODAD1 central coiled coil region domain-containing protein n=1 Tax=Haptolina brevifila TaxID=156173 RepID=A0A7S2N7U8_9EUKA|mmetsp:Transcript_69051/g.136883  ORF Transcript_69051/g.136883 Transcript_69051/m.136883 type:complete len:529 (+) Transcript_69051:109-1695(+)